MTAQLIVDGAAPWDGRYEISDWRFTNRELYRIKEISGGIRAGELLEALDANDTAAFVAVATIILGRHGKNASPDDFWDAPVGSLTIDLGPDGDADPPPGRPSGDSSENTGSSGPPSSGSGER